MIRFCSGILFLLLLLCLPQVREAGEEWSDMVRAGRAIEYAHGSSGNSLRKSSHDDTRSRQVAVVNDDLARIHRNNFIVVAEKMPVALAAGPASLIPLRQQVIATARISYTRLAAPAVVHGCVRFLALLALF